MRIAVLNEGSTKHRNADIIRVLSEFDHEIINIGMKNVPGEPDLNYVETGFLTGVVLNLGIADFVVSGCGTGQGYMNAALQFPNVFCGLIIDPIDAWLYSQVNAGNCISLALNKGYGALAGDLNMKAIFEQLFKDPFGQGYPQARVAVQTAARHRLENLSAVAHFTMVEILDRMDGESVKNALYYPGVIDLIRGCEEKTEEIAALKNALLKKYEALAD